MIINKTEENDTHVRQWVKKKNKSECCFEQKEAKVTDERTRRDKQS